MNVTIGSCYKKLSTGRQYDVIDLEVTKDQELFVTLREVNTIHSRYISMRELCSQYKEVKKNNP